MHTVPMGPLDRVTVVLLTYNCGHRVRWVLDRLAALGTPVIVVDNGSADDTRQVVAGVPGAELVALPGNLGAAARNAGLERASTPYVAFCDDDGWYERDGLAAAVDLLDAHPRLGLVNARILVGDEQRLDAISAEMAASPVPDRAGIPGPVLLSFMAGAAIVRRAAYQEVGGYDERFFIGGEEETLAVKLIRRGWQLRYAPGVVLQHRPSLANAGSLRHVGLRNTVVNAWLHRPLRSALRWTVFSLADAPKNRDFVRGLALILRAVPWIVRERAPMPAALDADLRLLDERRFQVRRRFLTFREDLGRSAYPRCDLTPGAAAPGFESAEGVAVRHRIPSDLRVQNALTGADYPMNGQRLRRSGEVERGRKGVRCAVRHSAGRREPTLDRPPPVGEAQIGECVVVARLRSPWRTSGGRAGSSAAWASRRSSRNPPAFSRRWIRYPTAARRPTGARASSTGKAAVITGGDSGIGRAVAIAYAREGADVLICYLCEDDDAEDTASWSRRPAAGRCSSAATCPSRSTAASSSTAPSTSSARIDVLVSNAAYQMTHESLEDIPRRGVGPHVRAPTSRRCSTWCKAALPHMPPGSSIIGSSSVNSDMPSPTLAPYAATKAAIANFSASLAQLLGPQGIRVNSVAPGPIWTPLIPSTMPPEKVENVRRGHPAGPGRASRPSSRRSTSCSPPTTAATSPAPGSP